MTTDQPIHVPSRVLDQFTHQVLEGLGVPLNDAITAAGVLGQANLRGVDTHGIELLPGYVSRIKQGTVKTKPRIKVLKEGVATMVIDADQSLGQISSRFAMQQAINKALLSGIGWVNVVNSNDHGALAYYSLMAAEQEMIGIVTTTTSSCMAPWGSREPLVGNNPLAIAAPCNNHEPLVLDMATSLLANSRVRLARDRSEPVPEGLSIDSQGNPNSDPDRSAALLPVGGYKGSGLAMMLGILSGVLAGAPFTGYPGGRVGGEASELSHLMIAVSIEQFTDLEGFKDSVDRIIDAWHRSDTRPGFDEVYVPGEIEWRRVPDREANGIPVSGTLAAKLSKIAEELELEWPPPD